MPLAATPSAGVARSRILSCLLIERDGLSWPRLGAHRRGEKRALRAAPDVGRWFVWPGFPQKPERTASRSGARTPVSASTESPTPRGSSAARRLPTLNVAPLQCSADPRRLVV
jgi:hypothetical protein